MKTCSKCGGEPKPETEFGKKSEARDGLCGQCKACNSIAAAARYAANPERIKARSAARYKANPEKLKAYIAEWQTENSEKVKASADARRKANPEKHRAATAKWNAANPEKRVVIADKWNTANPGKKAADTARWRADNPEAERIHKQNRRARERANGGVLSKGLAERLHQLQLGHCACGCKQPLGNKYHLDHIMPIALGGPNIDGNIQLLRQRCNSQKSAKHPIDFMRQRGFLL